MNLSKRKVIIAGNWKMNNNARQTKELISQMSAKITDSKATVLLCVPAINIRVAKQAAENSIINIGAENCHWAESGAYTGEISADMLDSYDVKYCISVTAKEGSISAKQTKR